MDVNWGRLAGMLALPALFAAMVLWIMWQNWRTRHWRATIGRIVESRQASRDVRTRESHLVGPTGRGSPTLVSTDRIERKNFAAIAYEYAVAGQTFRSRQVGVGKDHGNLDVVALLQRYPVGKVVTVHYDPASPGESCLERDDPRRIREAWLGIAILTALIVGGFYAFDHVLAFVQTHVRNRRSTPFVMFALAAAALMALIALGLLRGAWRMRTWPTADGVVVESHVAHAQTRRTRRSRTTVTPFFIPRVIYRFRVEGVEIQGDQLGRSVSSTARAAVDRIVAAYPVDTRVVVHYDPEQPTTAVVGPTAGMLPLGLAVGAAVLVGIAYALATF
jgi:hypothetical protein